MIIRFLPLRLHNLKAKKPCTTLMTKNVVINDANSCHGIVTNSTLRPTNRPITKKFQHKWARR
ncbi:hypothetical protein PILCRDRAFT_814373 [Piloderma croceum F 1598]|uniref:Uncharacterized protein n=1 Tax=Piloderma croceum (strain F 1598) TaxID=765440 RepID=A0A0C3G9Q9_PILCF|nr:hypothetical protein PILCRDRAFT_814373 [Piloderma croceum F 1598]